jgi:hypothetical protein
MIGLDVTGFEALRDTVQDTTLDPFLPHFENILLL